MPYSLRIFIVLLAIPALSACEEDEISLTGEANATPDLLEPHRTACERDGGRWGVAGNGVTFACYRDTRDANKQCRVAGDCEGHCLARSRTCSPIKPFFGCHQVLNQSGGVTTLCIE